MGCREDEESAERDGDVVRRLAAAEPQRDRIEAQQIQRRVASRLFGVEATPVKIGRFVVLERTGAGAMGVVLAAYDPVLERKVAIKLVPDRGEDLIAEARTLASLSHPNIVAVHDAGEHQDSVYMAMELVEGSTLRRWLEDKRRSQREILVVFLAAAAGLQAAHDASLVHRDFKPDNVVIGDDGRVRVLDFGLAKHSGETSPLARACPAEATHGDSSSGGTDHGVLEGTPAYVAPEQHAGAPADVRTDVYSFCVSLFEALCGQRPFRGETLAELEQAKLRRVRFPHSKPGGRLPPWLRRILLRGLAANPDDRYPDLGCLRTDLSRGLQRRRRLALAGAAFGILSAGVAYGELRARSPEPCPTPQVALLDAWEDGVGNEVRTSFLETRRPHADEAWSRADAGLRRFATRWSASAVAACRSTRVAGVWSDAMHSQATLCLAWQLDEAEALVDVFRQADASTIDRAPEAVTRLPNPDDCQNPRYLSQLEGSPAPRPEDRERIAELRRRLAKSTALRAAGRFVESTDEAKRVSTAAAELDAPALLAAAALNRELGLYGQGSVPEAREALEDALFTARSAGSGLTELQANIALVGVVGDGLGRREDGIRWSRLARATLKRSQPNPALEAELEIRLGEVMLRGLRYQAARDHFEAALAGLELAGRGDHPDAIYTRRRLADALAAEGDLDRADSLLRWVLATEAETLGPAHPDLAWTHNAIGLLRLQRGELLEGLDSIEIALAIRIESLGPDHQRVAHSLVSRAAILFALGRYRDARDDTQRAIDMIAERGASNQFQVSYRLNLARALAEMGELAQAEHVIASIGLDSASNEALTQARVVTEARIAELGGNPRSARELYQDVVNADSSFVEGWQGLARTRLALEDARGALEAIEEAESRVPTDAKLTRAQVSFDRARVRWALGHREEAREHANAAYETIAAAGVTSAGTAPLKAWLRDHR